MLTIKTACFAVLVVIMGILGALICWYYLFYDEGVRLGKQLGREAQAMRESHEDERVFTYHPLLGSDQQYWVGIGAGSKCDPDRGLLCGDSGLTVRVERGRSGSTTYHRRFVSVPNALSVEKHGESLQVSLHKVGDNVELVRMR